jgi:hypothetical protein
VATTLKEALGALEAAYKELYQARHKRRSEAFSTAIDDVKAHPDWPLVPEEMQESLLKPLADRAHEVKLPEGALTCETCEASLSEMASDLAAVDGMRSNVLMRVQELTAPEEQVERVRVSKVVGVGKTLGSEEEVEVEDALEQLRDHMVKMLASGAKVVLE